ncbi:MULTISPECIES: hypothetical protein [unclassified Thioalkalivibrio]|uniref:hypothetical protein n=1 Tax=unclassified Thioalkalivibrio TaxID=2621013 RepID=UPI001E3C0883|nr:MULTISPECIES: hypothetical protein [unclassified Thioalkalivibrio]
MEELAKEREMVLRGAHVSFGDDGIEDRKGLILHSIPMPMRIQSESLNGSGLPEGAITLLYGLRTPLSSVPALHEKTEKEDATVHPVKVRVQLPCPAGINATMENLPHIKMIHLDHAQRPLIERFTEEFLKAVRSEGITPKNKLGKEIESLSGLSMTDMIDLVGRYPEFLSKVLRTDDFKHIQLVIYRIREEGHSAIRASLFSADPVVETFLVEAPDFPVSMPPLGL